MDCPHELCYFGRDTVALPYAITSDPDVLKEMLTLETWNKVLSPEERRHLMSLLPPLDRPEHRETLQILFSGRPMRFTNPIQDLVDQIRMGQNQPDVLDLVKRSIRRKRREYGFRMKNYYYKLLKKSLVSRNSLLQAELANNVVWASAKNPSSAGNKKEAESLMERVEKRVSKEMRSIDLGSLFSPGKKSRVKLATPSLSSSSLSSSVDDSDASEAEI